MTELPELFLGSIVAGVHIAVVIFGVAAPVVVAWTLGRMLYGKVFKGGWDK